MTMRPFSILLCLSAPLFCLASTSIVESGDRLFSDAFAGASIDTGRWACAKGDWAVAQGAVNGNELESDQHAAVMRADVPFTDAVIRFRFKLEGCTAVSLSINEEKGHHSRLQIAPDGFSLVKDRDKKDPRSLQVPLGRCNVPILSCTWHTLVVEYSGPHLLACLDGRHVAIGTLDSIATPKANFGFTVVGRSAVFDDVEVFAAKPCVDQPGRVAELARQQAAQASVSPNPRNAYIEAETLLRQRLMATDDTFNALLSERIAVDEELHKRWPKAYRKGDAGTETRKQLLAENAEFKALNAKLAKARRAETAYLLKADPALAALSAALKKP